MTTARCCMIWIIALFFCCGGLAAQQASVSPTAALLRIDDASIRFHLLPEGELELPFVNTSGRPLDGDFIVELVHLHGEVLSSVKGTFHEEPGTNVEKITWGLRDLPRHYSPSELGWYRLRYSITPRQASDFALVRGVIQFAPLMVDAFEVRATAATTAGFGAKYPVHIRVDESVTGRPCAGVPVDVEISIDGIRQSSARVTTDKSGYAIMVFDLPESLSSRQGTVSATAHRGPFDEQQQVYFSFSRKSSLRVTTDKPLYQPGQTVHLRTLAFGPDKRAWKGAKVTVSIKDEEGNELFHDAAVTSEFGVATAEWETPQKIRLGNYSIQAQTESSKDHDQVYANAGVRLSRYDLPGFTVTATPDRTYYLPGQDPSIEVRADYLFGKPLQRARVKVVQLQNRYWNFREQRWTSQEFRPVEDALN